MNIVDIISATEEFKVRFKDSVENTEKATSFWNIYNPNAHELLFQRQYQLLRDNMIKLLQLCKNIDPSAYKKIHKGHPYFFIGISSYRLGDYQTAISFFDAALAEDLNIQDDKVRPSRIFFMLNGDDPNNGAQLETQYIETKVKRSINHYNKIVSQAKVIHEFDIQELRDNFINHIFDNKNDVGLRTLLTAFITFVVEWDFRNEQFELGVSNGTAEPLLTHLLRGCVLFESLLIRNPFPKEKHNDQKNDMFNLIVNNKDRLHLNNPPNQFPNKKTKFETLDELLPALSINNNDIIDSIWFTYSLRNILGHSLAWNVKVDQVSYQKLYFHVITACLHVINCLWRNPQ